MTKDIKLRIIDAGYKAVEELIKIAEEPILRGRIASFGKDDEAEDGDLSADRLKNAAATKKLAILDAFEILSRIEAEKAAIDIELNGPSRTDSTEGFAERRTKTKPLSGAK